MMEYMLTTKNGFNGGVHYYKTMNEAIENAARLNRVNIIPDEPYRLNPETKKYDILCGRFTAKKEA